MNTHNIVKQSDDWYEAQGIGDSFWWTIFWDGFEWLVLTPSGKTVASFKWFSQAIWWIERQ